MSEEKQINSTIATQAKKKAKDNIHISARESARITRENRRITDAIEKQRKRRNVPESE
jgi:peptide/nickel transport system ATP-binding protein